MSGSLNNVTVLVVDDNLDTCDLLRYALERSGATVVSAQTVQAAIDAFRRSPPHAVVSDIRVGLSDGYALIKTIRDYNEEYRGFTPAVTITGFASPEDEERALTAGFDVYLTKPFDPADVIAAIKRMLPGPDMAASA